MTHLGLYYTQNYPTPVGYQSLIQRKKHKFCRAIRDLYTIVELRLNLSFEKKKKKIADLEKKFFAFFGELGC